MLAPAPGPKKKTDAVTAAESGGDPMDEEAALAPASPAAGAVPAEDAPAAAAAGDDSADKGDQKADVEDDGKEPVANGAGDNSETAAAAAEKEDEKEKERASEPNGEAEAEGQHVSNGEAGHGSPERKEEERQGEEERMDDADVYKRDMGWLRSANGMVAEVRRGCLSTLYHGVSE